MTTFSEILNEDGITAGIGESEEQCSRCKEIYSIYKTHYCEVV